jgi:hypothetical protein
VLAATRGSAHPSAQLACGILGGLQVHGDPAADPFREQATEGIRLTLPELTITRPCRNMVGTMLILTLLALSSLPPLRTADELLPETPNNWRYERLEFPLTFAPELDFEGFEELRFAPGMFDPESASHFSYVFAIRIEQDLSVDAAFLEDFLRRYYRGLCAAVAEARELELALDSIAARVVSGEQGFVATIDFLDAFGSGAPLELRAELELHSSARHTELLGLVSPRPREAAIWSELEGVRERWRAARRPPATLNHLYVVPDADTYGALVDSPFLSDFGLRELRTTVRTDITYTGLYFYGESTYFEFLSPSQAFPQGSTGLAFGFERVGGAASAGEALAAAGIGASVSPITREFEGAQVPWFQMLGIQGAPSAPLSLFALEYDTHFLRSWYPTLEPAAGGISRREVLERYAAKLGQGKLRDDALLREVSAVHLVLDSAGTEHFTTLCTALDYNVEPAGESIVCDGPGVTFVVRTQEPSRGVTGLELALREPIDRETLELGRARLSFEGASALLEFRP